MQTNSGKTLKSVYGSAIELVIKPDLEELGFKKRRYTFYRKKGDFVQIIRFDRFWTQTRFAIDLKVHILSLPPLFKDKIPPKGSLASYSEYLSSRLITKEDKKKNLRDHGWVVSTSEKKVNLTMNEVLTALKDVGIPWLDSLSNYNKLRDIYEKERDQMLGKYSVGIWADLIGAIAYEKTGDTKKAGILYQKIQKSDYFKNLGKLVQNFVKKKI